MAIAPGTERSTAVVIRRGDRWPFRWRKGLRRIPSPKGGRKVNEQIRTGHRWVGAISAIFVLSLAVTGVLLNHPELLGVDGSRTEAIAYDPGDVDVIYRGSDRALQRSLDGGANWQEVPMLFPAEAVVDIVFVPGSPDRIYVVIEDLGVIRSTDGGVVWEPFSIGFRPAAEGIKLRRLAVSSSEEMSLLTSAGTYVSDAGGENWRPTGDSSSVDLYKVIHQIHTGYYFTNWFRYVHDGAGIALVSLVLTGLFLLRRRNTKSRRGFRS